MIMNNDKELFKDIKYPTRFSYENVDKVINQVLRGDYERLQGLPEATVNILTKHLELVNSI